jgi:hypothetical protein
MLNDAVRDMDRNIWDKWYNIWILSMAMQALLVVFRECDGADTMRNIQIFNLSFS